jgi:hypothetical protein
LWHNMAAGIGMLSGVILAFDFYLFYAIYLFIYLFIYLLFLILLYFI